MFFSSLAWAGLGRLPLPTALPPDRYGDIVMDNQSSSMGMEPVHFSHWSHRMRYTCRVCHTEVGFAMAQGQSQITMEEINNGFSCGACHNGKIAFAAEGEESNCGRCHGENALPEADKFKQMKSTLPASDFGNKVDWTRALRSGRISPKSSLEGRYKAFDYDKELIMTPPEPTIPPVQFPHKAHTPWLGCEGCHPEIFNVSLKGTERFSKKESLKGRFCGVCHLRVAFPFDDCTRCHINVWPE